MVTGSESACLISNLFDDSRGFVARHSWESYLQSSLHEVEVRATKARANYSDQDFSWPYRRRTNFFDLELPGDLAEHGSSHPTSRAAGVLTSACRAQQSL